MNSDLVIDVRDMAKRFGNLQAVRGISLQVRRGEIFGFLGANGSGKTTFLRMLCGLLRPDGGSGACLGLDVMREHAAIKLQVGYMTQRFSFYEDLTVRENLDFSARMYGVANRSQAIQSCLQQHGLQSRAQQLAGELSGGWKQRLALAACLIHQPRLLLLDEPTAGVDPKARRDFWQELHRLASTGVTILVTTHYMDEAERCHRLAYVSFGKLLALGSVAEIVQAARLFTWSIEGAQLADLTQHLQQQPGVEQVVPFGAVLHVSGRDEAALEATMTALSAAQPLLRCAQTRSSLEDVFIALMRDTPESKRSQ